MKTWTCTQCGNAVDRGLVASVRGAPSECDVCGNDDFEDPVTLGSVHATLDGILP